jgi:hypothetical protein
MPVAGLTTIQALRDFGGLRSGQSVLIHAGAGGVGSFAIQYAKFLGAKVYTGGSYIYGINLTSGWNAFSIYLNDSFYVKHP